jgi:AMP phosphorylase
MGTGPADLTEKATSIAGILFEMVGLKNGKMKASRLLESGKAERKLREIIAAQGGNPDITPEEMRVGDKTVAITATKGGSICWVNNRYIAQVAREAGAPKEHGAGVMLKAKLGDRVQKGDVLFEIYSERSNRLKTATNQAKRLQPIGISGKLEETMMMGRIPARTIHRKSVILER